MPEYMSESTQPGKRRRKGRPVCREKESVGLAESNIVKDRSDKAYRHDAKHHRCIEGYLKTGIYLYLREKFRLEAFLRSG